MPTDETQLKAILSDLPDLSFSWRKMMGEYLLYSDGVLVGGIYDGRLLIKDTEKGRENIPMPELQLPYPGAKPMLYIDGETRKNGALMKNLIAVTAESQRKRGR